MFCNLQKFPAGNDLLLHSQNLAELAERERLAKQVNINDCHFQWLYWTLMSYALKYDGCEHIVLKLNNESSRSVWHCHIIQGGHRTSKVLETS